MLAASQDIDSFIERQRSKLNRQSSNRPPPPPPQQSAPPNNVQDRLDFKVARILDEPPPRVQPPPQSYYPPTSPQYAPPDQQAPFFPEQQQQQEYRRMSNGNTGDNREAFFNKFGTYDDKRTQLKDDLKREYNEYLQNQKGASKSKSTSQIVSPRSNNNRRVQFQPNGKVVAPWEKGDQKTMHNVQSMQDLSSTTNEYASNRSHQQVVRNQDERYQVTRNQDERHIRDREEYISELHAQIRELEARKKQLEMQSNKLSAGGSSNITRAHYTEDIHALDSLLAERLDQRNAVDLELAHILNRPPVSSSPTRLGSGNIPALNMPLDQSRQMPNSQRYPQANGRAPQQYRNDPRAGSNDNGFQIGNETDKDSEQAAKKRYQQELQAQMREAQMRKAQSKREKDDYERKLDVDIQRYNYFGRSGGGGAPMRDKEGNVVANLADLRNPPQSTQPPSQYSMPDDKVYTLGSGTSAMANAPFFMGEQQQSHPSNTDRSGSPNHARGAASNGMFGVAKTEEQFSREEKYKQDLKKQIDDKRQRGVDEIARRRAEEERELAKHIEWQQQMDKQAAEEAAKKQEKEAQDRQQQQQLQDGLERQRQQDEAAARRKPKKVEKPMTSKKDDVNDHVYQQNSQEEPDQQQQQQQQQRRHQQQQQSESAYRSSSPPVPTLKNKGKKPKAKNTNVQRPSFDDAAQRTSPPPLPPLNVDDDDDFAQPLPVDETDVGQGRQTYRKPPTPRQPDVSSARKKPPQAHQARARPISNTGMPMRTNSNLSLRSDGSDSEVLNRLEHLKRQLKDKEALLQEHVIRHQGESSSGPSHIGGHSKTTYQPPSQPPPTRKQSPGFLLNAARMHHRDSPTNDDRVRRLLQTDDDLEYKPSYFRDDTVLMSGIAGGQTGREYNPTKRVDSADRVFGTTIEKEASRRRYGHEPSSYYDRDDPTTMANFELNRIAEQNEHRLKKLRDLENDDASLLDSNEVLERFQQKQRLQRGGSQTTLQDDAWLK